MIRTNTLSHNCILILLVLLAFLFLLVPPTSKAADSELSTYQLSNGLKIYVIEKHTAPVATVSVWYHTGPLNEHPGIRGLSHLFEHMMFRGSEHFGPEEHDRRISQVGGSSNAYTSEDVTVYHQIVPAHAVDLVMEMEADRMARLKLDAQMLETEVEVVKEEYRVGVENDPMGHLLFQFAKQYFGDHPYGYAVLGDMNDLDTVSVNTCLAYYRARYAPNNAALIVAGDVAPEAVLEMAERHFGSIPAHDSIATDPSPPAPKPPAELRGNEDLPVPLTGIAYRLPPAGDEDMPALEVMVSILGKRLEQRLTRESSICVYLATEMMPMRQASVAAIIAAHLPNISHEKVRKAIDAEIAQFLAEPLPLEELDRTRNQTLLGETLGRAKVEAIAEGVGNAVFVDGDLDRYTKRLESLAALTPEVIMETAKRHFIPGNRTEMLIEPKHPSLLLKIAGWLKTTLHI
jgi:zinc protease